MPGPDEGRSMTSAEVTATCHSHSAPQTDPLPSVLIEDVPTWPAASPLMGSLDSSQVPASPAKRPDDIATAAKQQMQAEAELIAQEEADAAALKAKRKAEAAAQRAGERQQQAAIDAAKALAEEAALEEVRMTLTCTAAVCHVSCPQRSST